MTLSMIGGLALTFGFAIVLHRFLCRVHALRNKVLGFVIAGGICGCGLTFFLLRVYGLTIDTLAILMLYASLVELYIFLFTMIMSSVSVSLLLRLETGELSQGEVDLAYSAEGMVSRRLGRLVDTGLALQTDRGYQVSARGRRLVSIFRVVRALFGLSSDRDSVGRVAVRVSNS